MALRNAFENLGLDSTLQAIRDRLPAALGGNGGIKVEQQGAVTSKLQDGSGNAITSTASALDVNVKSGGGTDVVTGNVASGAADSGNPVKVAGVASSAAPTAATAGQRKDLWVGLNGQPVVSLTTTRAANLDGASNNNTIFPVDAAGNLGALLTYPAIYNGSSWDRPRSDGTTGGRGVGGTVASGASDSGNPVKFGGVGKTANPTAVTDGQRVNAVFDKLGKQVVVNSIRDLKGVQQTTITSSVAETTIVTAVASTFLDVYGLILTNSSAIATTVTIKDATAGTTRAVFVVPASDTRGLMLTESAAMPQAAINNNWTATCGTSVASLQVTALYVKNT